LIGDWPDSDRLTALICDWRVIKPGQYAVNTRLNGPAHIMRVKVL
jgi:hypothetical protein